jgi:hypothetical protein
MNIYDLFIVFHRYFRTKRMRWFWQRFGLNPESRVLDVGGIAFNWMLLPCRCHVTFLNLSSPDKQTENMTFIIGDCRWLPFKDGSFDVAYSNSVIEHLGTPEDQHLFACECMRVGRRYYVQTPDKCFFVEPHLITPFIHWLPRRIQSWLLRYFTVWGLLTKPNQDQCHAFMNEVRLLGRKDLQELFPGADIWHERFCGMSKSLIAVKSSKS